MNENWDRRLLSGGCLWASLVSGGCESLVGLDTYHVSREAEPPPLPGPRVEVDTAASASLGPGRDDDSAGAADASPPPPATDCVGGPRPRDCSSPADNDCDGKPDNTLDGTCRCQPDLREPCDEHGMADGRGPCRAGERVCRFRGASTTSSDWGPCTGSVGPLDTDDCNVPNDDSNCDGTPNGPPTCTCRPGDTQECGPRTSSDALNEAGICRSGVISCEDGSFGACAGAVFPARRDCASAEDNDCDGSPDNAGVGASCQAAATGACARGTTACRAGSVVCTAGAPRAETCNGVDDDCDGDTDESSATSCENGRCRASGGSFFCDCSGSGFGGNRCQTALVTVLEVTISTGGDDLRGGNDNAELIALLDDGRQPRVPINGTARLADNTTRVVRLDIPDGVAPALIGGIQIATTFGGGPGGDNWNINALSVEAITLLGGTFIFSQAGNPLVRLTGTTPQVTFDL